MSLYVGNSKVIPVIKIEGGTGDVSTLYAWYNSRAQVTVYTKTDAPSVGDNALRGEGNALTMDSIFEAYTDSIVLQDFPESYSRAASRDVTL